MVAGSGGRYRVSSLGRVQSSSSGWLDMAQQTTTKGYKTVHLSYGPKGRRPYRVHRLVARAFLPKPRGKDLVCHENGDPGDNRLTNLRGDTCRANHADRERHGNTRRGESHGMAKLTDELALGILASCGGERRVAKHFGISPTTVGDIRRGRTWAHLRALPTQEKSGEAE